MASILNISISAVSKALNDSPEISINTKNKVLDSVCQEKNEVRDD